MIKAINNEKSNSNTAEFTSNSSIKLQYKSFIKLLIHIGNVVLQKGENK